MQNWYSQNNPLKLKAVGEGKGVEMGTETEVGRGMAAKVAATA